MTICGVLKAVFLNGTNQVCAFLYKVQVLMFNHVQREKLLEIYMLCAVAACPIRNRSHYMRIFSKPCNHQQVLPFDMYRSTGKFLGQLFN